jgi:hypothetical protein
MNWYQLADENIGDQQWFAFLYSSYQEILATAAEKLKTKAPHTKRKCLICKINPPKTLLTALL